MARRYAAGTKPQGSTADEHASRESAKAAGVKAERNRRYDNNECLWRARTQAAGLPPKPTG